MDLRTLEIKGPENGVNSYIGDGHNFRTAPKNKALRPRVGPAPDFPRSSQPVGIDECLYFGISRYMEQNDALLALSALAQPTRLEAFRLLVQHEPEGLPAGEISRLLDVPQNTMSTHLGQLSRAGLVASERHSRSIVYRASLEGLRALTMFLLNDCCGGRSEICTPISNDIKKCCPPKERRRA